MLFAELPSLITPQHVLLFAFLAFGYLVCAAIKSNTGQKIQGQAAKSFLSWLLGKLK